MLFLIKHLLFVVLASWFRLKYPHVTIGALASSAPILQFDYITPWSSFYDVVSQDYKVLPWLQDISKCYKTCYYKNIFRDNKFIYKDDHIVKDQNCD